MIQKWSGFEQISQSSDFPYTKIYLNFLFYISYIELCFCKFAVNNDDNCHKEVMMMIAHHTASIMSYRPIFINKTVQIKNIIRCTLPNVNQLTLARPDSKLLLPHVHVYRLNFKSKSYKYPRPLYRTHILVFIQRKS